MRRRVVVIGGGITGLTLALRLRDLTSAGGGAPLDVVLLEASGRVGGNIRTDETDGYRVEWGPNGYLDNVSATPELVRRLGLETEVQQADAAAARRFLYLRGRLRALPSGPASFLTSSVLSVPGKLRLMAEPFAKAPRPGVDESVFDFVRRRIGEEAATVLVDAMVSGVFAGDSRQLSLVSSFPKMAAMESEHGGLVRAMLARRRAARDDETGSARQRARGGPAGPGGILTSFRSGLETLVSRLAVELGPAVRPQQRIVGLLPPASGGERPGRWRVLLADEEPLAADVLVVTTPAPRAAELLQVLDGSLADALRAIPTAAIAVVALGFDRSRLGHPLDGFGFLVPRGQGPRILGCLWDSSIFPGRAPPERALVRAMIGGARDPDALLLDDEELVQIVAQDLEATMGVTAQPELVRVYRHPLGIAQYTVGHGHRVAAIRERASRWPGLHLLGSSYDGVSMNACIESATGLAAALAADPEDRTAGQARGGAGGVEYTPRSTPS